VTQQDSRTIFPCPLKSSSSIKKNYIEPTFSPNFFYLVFTNSFLPCLPWARTIVSWIRTFSSFNITNLRESFKYIRTIFQLIWFTLDFWCGKFSTFSYWTKTSIKRVANIGGQRKSSTFHSTTFIYFLLFLIIEKGFPCNQPSLCSVIGVVYYS